MCLYTSRFWNHKFQAGKPSLLTFCFWLSNFRSDWEEACFFFLQTREEKVLLVSSTLLHQFRGSIHVLRWILESIIWLTRNWNRQTQLIQGDFTTAFNTEWKPRVLLLKYLWWKPSSPTKNVTSLTFLNFLEMDYYKVPWHVVTRWLSLLPAVERIHDNWRVSLQLQGCSLEQTIPLSQNYVLSWLTFALNGFRRKQVSFTGVISLLLSERVPQQKLKHVKEHRPRW